MRQHLWHGFHNPPSRGNFLAIVSTVCVALIASLTTEPRAEDARAAGAVMGTSSLSLRTDSKDDQPVSPLLRVKVALLESGVRLTLAMNLESKDRMDHKLQPGSRVMRTRDARDALWKALSVALGEPSFAAETVRINWQAMSVDALFPGLQLALMDMVNDENPEPGYGAAPSDRLLLGIGGLYNTGGMPRAPEPSMALSEILLPQLRSTIRTSGDNDVGVKTYGVELALDWRLLGGPQMQSVYAHLQNQWYGDGHGEAKEENTPRQFYLQSHMDVSDEPEFDSWHRYVDNLHNSDLEDYANPDGGLGFQLTRKLELSIAGRDPLDDRHREFLFAKSPMPQWNEVERSVHVGMTLQF